MKNAMMAVTAFLAVIPAVNAQSAARDLQDLVNVRARDGELELQNRGYRLVRNETRDQARINYWQRGSDCVEVEVYDGRYSYLNRVSNSYCSSRGGSNNRDRTNDYGRSVNAPDVNVDTSGRGTFTSQNGPNGRVTRGFVNTRDRPSVGFRVEGNVVTFYGRITNRRSDREFDMVISDSSEGRASGTARFRLNGDHNEVDLIQVNGDLKGRHFSGNFNR